MIFNIFFFFFFNDTATTEIYTLSLHDALPICDVRLVNPWMGCGQCKVCQLGDENLCLTPQNVGVFSQGGYATHLLAPHPRHLFDIGNLKPEQAAPLACSGVTAFS